MTPSQTVGEDRPPRNARRGWMALALALAALAALRLVAILLREDAYGIAKYYMADDAFYYFQTARNFATGLGTTFDGVHVTNGYHPLWFLISAGVFALLPGSTAPLMVLYALQIGMLVGAAVLLFLALREIDPVAGAFTVVLFLASYHSRKILFTGMESTLAFLLTSGLLLLAVRKRTRFFVPATWRETLVLFALLLALSLARLEAGFLAASWVAIALVVDAREGGHARRRILLVGLGLAAAACAYVASNLYLVGVPFPISGLVKAGGHHAWSLAYAIFQGHLDSFEGLIAPPGHNRWVQGIRATEDVALTLALLVLLLRLRRHDPGRMLALAPFLLFALMFMTVSALVTRGGWYWYRWPALLAGMLATFALVHFVLARIRPVRLGLGLLALVVTLAIVPDWVLTLRKHTLADWSPLRGFVMDETIRFIREQIPADERIGGVSNGIYAYFSGRQVENLEGLANGAAFYHARLDPLTYAAYLRESRIRWIVFHAWSRSDRAGRFATYVPASQVDRVYDLDGFYHLDLQRSAYLSGRPPDPTLSNPNVYFVRLRP
jgi:hypothetical protein